MQDMLKIHSAGTYTDECDPKEPVLGSTPSYRLRKNKNGRWPWGWVKRRISYLGESSKWRGRPPLKCCKLDGGWISTSISNALLVIPRLAFVRRMGLMNRLCRPTSCFDNLRNLDVLAISNRCAGGEVRFCCFQDGLLRFYFEKNCILRSR